MILPMAILRIVFDHLLDYWTFFVLHLSLLVSWLRPELFESSSTFLIAFNWHKFHQTFSMSRCRQDDGSKFLTTTDEPVFGEFWDAACGQMLAMQHEFLNFGWHNWSRSTPCGYDYLSTPAQLHANSKSSPFLISAISGNMVYLCVP